VLSFSNYTNFFGMSDGRMTVNDELQRMWKEWTMAYLKALSQDFIRMAKNTPYVENSYSELSAIVLITEIYQYTTKRIWFYII
jgi:hypothetical protein